MSELKNIPVASIEADPQNPRERFPQDELERLAESIDQVGILVPIVVYDYDDHFRLLDGERRWRCARTLGLEVVPAVVVEKPTETERLTQMFNIHLVREEWQDIPTAHALKNLMKETGIDSPSQLAQMTGLSTQQINRYKFALDLGGEVAKAVESGDVPLNYFYEVYRAVVKPLQKSRPSVFASYSQDIILDKFLEKRLSGAIPDIVSVRDAQYIIRKAAEDDPDNEKEGPLDKTLRRLLEDSELSVKDAYEDTVMISVEADKLENRAGGIVTAFERLLNKAVDDSERDSIRKIGRGLIKSLKAVIG